MIKVDDTTYKDDITMYVSVEYGDSKQSVFYPQLKSMFYNNECNVSMRLDIDVTGGVLNEKTNELEWGKGDIIARMYRINDGMQFEIQFNSKPSTNTVQFTLQDKAVVYYYQDVLEDWQQKAGWHRPDDVVGSYAVYHLSKKDGKYQTGKLYHIYAPYITDANNKTEKCVLLIKDSVMTYTMSQTFLDNAQYPIILR